MKISFKCLLREKIRIIRTSSNLIEEIDFDESQSDLKKGKFKFFWREEGRKLSKNEYEDSEIREISSCTIYIPDSQNFKDNEIHFFVTCYSSRGDMVFFQSTKFGEKNDIKSIFDEYSNERRRIGFSFTITPKDKSPWKPKDGNGNNSPKRSIMDDEEDYFE